MKLNTKPDEDLIQMVKAGNQPAFTVLYNRHKARVKYTIQEYVKNDSDAEEIVNNTFVSGFNSISTFTGESLFTTWIRSIARNKAIDYTRLRSTREKHSTVGLTIAELYIESKEVTISQQIAAEDLEHDFKNAFKKLPVLFQDVLSLSIQGLGYPEASERLGVNKNSFAGWLLRARALIKKEVL